MSVGLICEFNPFHFGHEYIIKRTRELSGDDVVCLMSGPFVQRAEPAITDKWARTMVALLYGASAVIELPVIYAVSPAPIFAGGAIKLLKSIKGLDRLAFGVECEPKLLYEIAKIKNTDETNEVIRQELDLGVSYPNAIARALNVSGDKDITEILNKPNNILAIEYICALENSGIEPLPIRRVGSSYNDKLPTGKYASATAIREMLSSGNAEVEKYMPAEMISLCKTKPDYDLFDSLMLFSLRKLTCDQIRELPFVENGLEYKIIKAVNRSTSAREAIEQIKTKRYTYSRLKRIFLYALLGITQQVMSDIIRPKTRILGIKEQFKPFLSNLNTDIVIRNSDISEPNYCLSINDNAEDIYSLLTKREANKNYLSPLIIVK